MMIQNPILRGFCPDPSIVRVGSDYYIATSTFEWWPGVKLFHSRDLQNWRQLPSPLRRKSQLDLTGDPNSGGVWAPCLSWDGQRFYLVYTDVKTKKGRYYNTHNYVVWAEDICGPWSDPVYLNSIGFDPSLFHDTDGRKYLVNMVNGFRGILVQEVDPVSFRLVGPRKKVYSGSGIGCTEGPHMYHIGNYYYLIVAEGGTGYDHCVTLARSESVWGPFETAPDNPILTSCREDTTALQKCGHADITDTPNGDWYLVHLCSRPLEGHPWCTLGRETAIQKMAWDADVWLRLEGGGKFARKQVPGPEVPASSGDSADFRDTFDSDSLHVRYVSPRGSYESFADLHTRPGVLRLTGQESMNSLHHVSLLAVRQQSVAELSETCMEFTPEYPEQLAGLSYLYDSLHFYLLAKTVDDSGVSVLNLLASDAGVIQDVCDSVPVPAGALRLRAQITVDGMAIQFSWAGENGIFQPIGPALTTELMTDEHCRGFTGAHFGLYIHDMTGLHAHADFLYWERRCL